MKFRNRHSILSDLLCGALILTGGCALGGCTKMTETQDIGGAGGTAPLTIRVTAGGFAAAGEDGAPDTRTPTEDGFTTKFTNGDAIGIFAIRGIGTAGATLIDGTSNLKLVCTTAADGTPDWAPASGDTHVLYSYDETLTYVAYYPYRDGITINPAGTADEITQALADNTALQPAADQSTPTAYTGSDLMTAAATPAADLANANKKVLTLAFTHRYALLVLKPRGLTKCVAPTGGGFEYKDAALGWSVDIDARDAIINGTKALRMADGTFRAILKTTATDVVTPTGSYKAKGGKTVLYTGAALAAGQPAAGKCYTQQSDVPLLLERTEERALQIGDYFARDGKILSRETPDIANPTDYVGIVLATAGGSDASFGGNCVNNTIHGHVISVWDVAYCKWGPNGNIGTNTADSWGDWRGYQLTQRMKEDADANYGGFSTSNYAAAYYCLNYGNTDRGRLTATKTSGWYFPSEGYMYRWAMQSWGDINGSLTRLVSAGYGQNVSTKSYYWDASTGNSDATARVVQLNPGDMGYIVDRSRSFKVRAVLTF